MSETEPVWFVMQQSKRPGMDASPARYYGFIPKSVEDGADIIFKVQLDKLPDWERIKDFSLTELTVLYLRGMLGPTQPVPERDPKAVSELNSACEPETTSEPELVTDGPVSEVYFDPEPSGFGFAPAPLVDPDKEPLMQWFRFDHLPEHLAEVSEPFCNLAKHIVIVLPKNQQRDWALLKLIEAKDAAVRSRLSE